jgi:hypothetical protein
MRGVAAVLIAEVFRPGRAMPIETSTDRLFLNLFMYGVPSAMVGLPFVCFALVGAFNTIRRERLSSIAGRTVLLTAILAVGAAAYLIQEIETALDAVGPRSVVSGRSPVRA